MLLNNLNSLNINIVNYMCFSQISHSAVVIFSNVAQLSGTEVLLVDFLVQNFYILP